MFRIDSKTTLAIRLTALILSIVWSGFWIFFAFATLTSEPFSVKGMLITFAFFIFFSTVTILSWKYPKRGGISTILIGLIVIIGYPAIVGMSFPATIFVIASMGLPPVISGVLNLIFWKRLNRECPESCIDSLRIKA